MKELTRRPAAVLAVTCTAAFMATLDVFVVNVAFPAISADFGHARLSDLSWTLNAYTITFAALLVPLGRLADRVGRKAVFLAGVGVFTLSSVASGLAPGLWWLVAFRVLQAIGAAALTPTSLGLLLNAMPAERRATSVKIWAVVGTVAAAIGPVVGGALVQIGWRWVFFMNAPVGVIAVVAAIRFVPDSRDPAAGRIPDIAGSTAVAASVAALALAVVKGPDWGWASPATLVTFAVAVLAGVLVAWRILHHPVPVVEPSLLRVRTFAWSNAAALTYGTAFGASLLISVLWVQDVWHYRPLVAGLAIAPGPLTAGPFTVVADRLARRLPLGVVTAFGCLVFGAGAVFLLATVGEHPHFASEFLPGWMIGGAGVGLTLPAILSSATANLPPARVATGSAVVSMSRQIGMALGVSILVAVLGSPVGWAATHAAFQAGWWAVAAISAVAAVSALGMTPRQAAVEVAVGEPLVAATVDSGVTA